MNRNKILSKLKETYGTIPDWLGGMPDPILEQFFALDNWINSDTKLSVRDKAMICYGAATAIHCEYWIPFHTAQFALFEMGEEHVKEASWVVLNVTGFSAYLYGIGYSKEKFLKELDAILEHVKNSAE